MRRDLLTESERLAYVAGKLRRSFESWGYREIFLPCIEEYDGSLRRGTKFSYNNQFYLIKPDITSQIVFRMRRPRRMKVYYISEVLNGGIKGSWQAGAELIGGEPSDMYVEVIKVAVSCLIAVGVEDFYVDVGSLEVWRRATEDVKEFRERIFEALRRRNFQRIESLPIDQEKKRELWRLFNFRGRRSGFRLLDEIVERVEDERVFIDLGTMRPLPYYDNVVFDIYSPKLGYPIGGGGDYRARGLRAAGFALYLDRVLRLRSGEV